MAAALLVLNESALNHVPQAAMDFAARVPGAPVPRVERLVMARQGEGVRLGQVLLDLVGQMRVLRAAAEAEAAAQPGQQRERLVASLAALTVTVPALPEERIAQEVAVVASRSDVREELDRLGSHIEAVLALFEGRGRAGAEP